MKKAAYRLPSLCHSLTHFHFFTAEYILTVIRIHICTFTGGAHIFVHLSSLPTVWEKIKGQPIFKIQNLPLYRLLLSLF